MEESCKICLRKTKYVNVSFCVKHEKFWKVCLETWKAVKVYHVRSTRVNCVVSNASIVKLSWHYHGVSWMSCYSSTILNIRKEKHPFKRCIFYVYLRIVLAESPDSELEKFSSPIFSKFVVECDWNGKISQILRNLGFLNFFQDR